MSHWSISLTCKNNATWRRKKTFKLSNWEEWDLWSPTLCLTGLIFWICCVSLFSSIIYVGVFFFYSHAVSWPTCISPVSPRATGLAASVAASFTLSLLQWSKTSTTYSGSASVTVLKWKQENVNHSCRLMNSLIRDSVRTYLHIRFLAEVYDNPPAEVKVLISDLWCHK